MLIISKTNRRVIMVINLAVLLWAGAMSVGGCTVSSDPFDGQYSDIKTHSDFEPASQVENAFLVVTIELTKSTMTTTSSQLVLGQAKTSSSIADLHIIALADDSMVAEYYAPDPRFSMVEGGGWNEAAQATLRLYVPLSANIDEVTILPVPGRETVVSAGGVIKPRPLMKAACIDAAEIDEDVYFPECVTISLIVVP